MHTNSPIELMPDIFLAHELLEWFNCPRKTYYTHREGCKSLVYASALREQIRAINALIQFKKDIYKNCSEVRGSTLEESAFLTQELINSKKHPLIAHATFIHKNIAAYIPFMQWNKKLQGWKIILPALGHGVKQENLQLTTIVKFILEAIPIPVYKLSLSYFNDGGYAEKGVWVDSDISSKVNTFVEKEGKLVHTLINFINSDSDEKDDITKWAPCNRQYCDYCATHTTYEVDDIQTLRRAKVFIEELKSKDISKITDIPNDMIPNNSVLHRQIEAVCTDKTIVLNDEVEEFMQKLKYPRYFLDFEAFNTSAPYSYAPPYIPKQWNFTPFLFSLQWQEAPEEKIHTLLWSMIPGKNQTAQMWKVLKEHLLKAGSIVVYGSQFEINMIEQMSHANSDSAVGQELLSKIVDLQGLFFNLSIYNPEQKGKISLKTVTPIWVKGDYNSFKVNEGIAANYYFTSMTDEKLKIFDDVRDIPYVSAIFSFISKIEDTSITLKDIAEYCKYDTEVMVRIVSQLQALIES